MRRRPTARSTNAEARVRVVSMLACAIAVAIAAAAFHKTFSRGVFSYLLPVALLVCFCAVVYEIARFILLAKRVHRETAGALEVSERKYKSVFDNAFDGIVIFDDEGACIEANPAAGSLFGCAEGDSLRRSIQTFLLKHAAFHQNWKTALNRRSEEAEAKIVRADGSTVCVAYTVTADFLPGFHACALRDITRKKQAETALRESERRFQQMADNIQEVFWMFDAKTRTTLYVNAACEALTGRTREEISGRPQGHTEVIHPEDRGRILQLLERALETGDFDEEFRIVRPDKTIRWVRVRGFPVRDEIGIIHRLVGTAQDVTKRRAAEEQMAHNFDLAEAARAEAEALRKASLALTQNLSMDYVLGTLLKSLLPLVPCELAQVIMVEADTHLFLAREIANYREKQRARRSPDTFDARDSQHLLRALVGRTSVLIPNTDEDVDWHTSTAFSHLRSWLCVPLIASDDVLGFLALGDTKSHAFTPEHLRLAKSLAVPAAVAIQNARLYEQAEIFRTALEHRPADVGPAPSGLARGGNNADLA
jgi:PAS domain S-box-containing protein